MVPQRRESSPTDAATGSRQQPQPAADRRLQPTATGGEENNFLFEQTKQAEGEMVTVLASVQAAAETSLHLNLGLRIPPPAWKEKKTITV